jgi:hippurate hydrolase
MSESAEKYLHELLGEKKVFTTASFGRTGGNNKSAHSAGSEDFAYISREVPSVMLALAAGNPDKGYTYSQHHPKVKFDEDVLPIGSAAYAYTAMRWLEENREAD